MKNYKMLSLILGGLLLTVTVAGASVYVAKQADKPEKPFVQASAKSQTPTQPSVPRCNDGNIAGKVVGGVGGGVAGSMLGKGTGKTAATIGGTLGGAYIGGEVIPLENVTCPR